MPQHFEESLLQVDKLEFSNILRIVQEYQNLICELEDKLKKGATAVIIDSIGVDSDYEVYIDYSTFDLNNYKEVSGFCGYIKVRDDD